MCGRVEIGHHGVVPGFSGVVVDEVTGQRWELALELIESGEAPVKLGDVVIERNVTGPTADGVISLAVTVDEHADVRVGQAALSRGRAQVDDAAAIDPRLVRLFDQYGCRWEVVTEYGMGAVVLGKAERDGSLTWRP